MAEPNCGIRHDTNAVTLLASPAVDEAEGEGNPAGSTPETAPAEPAPSTTQETQTAGQAPENVTVEQAFTLPDIPDVGITTLYTPPEGVAVVADLVFVHGLKGRPLKTWLCGKIPKAPTPCDGKGNKGLKGLVPRFISKKLGGKKGGKQKEANTQEEDMTGPAQSGPEKWSYCYWPFDLVPKDFGNVRVMTYGYDSDPTHWYKTKTTQMTITQRAQQLRNKVNRERIHCRGRPLIFVAHSLGGILVKDAIVQSLEMKHQPDEKDIADSCQHIFFFGTPHLGAGLATWGSMLSDIVGALPGGFSTYGEVLRGLYPDSETLDNISRRFNALLNDTIPISERIHICSFQEGQGMSSVKGAGSKVVPDSSSMFNRTDLESRYFVPHGNHMTMCEFPSAAYDAYKDFKYVLTKYLLEIKTRQDARQNQHAALRTAAQTAMLEDLNFGDRIVRQQQLGKIVTVAPSFEWVWSSQFVTWIQSAEQLFWITGHPASGKSTLINYLINEKRIRDMVKKASGKSSLLVSFFFDYRANHGIRNNFQGLRRSLLYQLLSVLGGLASEVRTHFELSERNSHEWLGDDNTLASVLEFVLRKLTVPVLLFLDGLDEYGGEKVELLSLVDDLTAAGVRVCLASRDETPFSLRFRSLASLRMDKVNRTGIMSFATTFLTRNLNPSTQEEEDIIDSLAKEVTKKSAGVFLWARFAVLAIIDAKGQGLNEHALNAKLAIVPPDLEKIYARIFESKSSKDRQKSGIVLRLVTSAKRDIFLSELFEASYLAGVLTRSSDVIVNKAELHEFARYTLALGGGVLELCPVAKRNEEGSEGAPRSDPARSSRCEYVKVIHRSVHTYLDKGGWSVLLGDDDPSTFRSLTWLKVCAAFCKQDKLLWTNPERRPGLNLGNIGFSGAKPGGESSTAAQRGHAEISLSNFVGLYLPQFASDYELESGKSSWSLIHTVMTPSFASLHVKLCESYGIFTGRCPKMYGESKAWALHAGLQIAVAHNLLGFVQDEIQHNPAHPALTSACEQSALSYRPSERRHRSEGPSQALRTSAKPGHRNGLSLLQIAVLCSSEDPGSRRSALVSFLAGVSPRLKDQDMSYAIQNAPIMDVRSLLLQFPPGPLQLQSSILFHDEWARDRELAEPQTFGPLWAVACRRKANNETAEMLDMFLQRGENINGLCGPYGTVLHAALAMHVFNFGADTQGMLSLLIQRGADLNLPGPDGNVLEYLWKLTNTRSEGSFDFASRYAPLIRYFIDRGAVNRRADPNGSVPSLELMLTFGTTMHLFICGQQYYAHGRILADDMGKYHEDYRRAYDIYVRPRLLGAQVLEVR